MDLGKVVRLEAQNKSGSSMLICLFHKQDTWRNSSFIVDRTEGQSIGYS